MALDPFGNYSDQGEFVGSGTEQNVASGEAEHSGKKKVAAHWSYKEPWTVWLGEGGYNVVVISDKEFPEDDKLDEVPEPEVETPPERTGLPEEDPLEVGFSNNDDPDSTSEKLAAADASIVKAQAAVDKAFKTFDELVLANKKLHEEFDKEAEKRRLLDEQLAAKAAAKDLAVLPSDDAKLSDADIDAMYANKLKEHDAKLAQISKKIEKNLENQQKAKDNIEKKKAALNETTEKANKKKEQAIEEGKTPIVKAMEGAALKGLYAILEYAGKKKPAQLKLDSKFVSVQDYAPSDSPYIKMKVWIQADQDYVIAFPSKTQFDINEEYEKYYLERDARYSVTFEKTRLSSQLARAAQILEEKQYLLETGFPGYTTGVNMNDEAEQLRQIYPEIEKILNDNADVDKSARTFARMVQDEMAGETAYLNFFFDETHKFSAFSYIVGDRVFFMRDGISKFAELEPIQSRKVMFLLYHLPDILVDDEMQVLDFIGKYYQGAELKPSGDKDKSGDNLEDNEERYNDLGIRKEKFEKNKKLTVIVDDEENSYLRRVKDLASAYSKAISKIDIMELMGAAVSCLSAKRPAGDIGWPPNLLGTLPVPNIEWPSFSILDWLNRLSEALDKAIRDALDQQVVDIMKELMKLLEEGCRDSVDYGKHRLADYVGYQVSRGDTYAAEGFESATGYDLAEVLFSINHPSEVAQASLERGIDNQVNAPIAKFKTEVAAEIDGFISDVSDTLNPRQLLDTSKGKPSEETTQKSMALIAEKHALLLPLLNTKHKVNEFYREIAKRIPEEKIVALEKDIELTPEIETFGYPPKKRYVCGDKQFVNKKVQLYKDKGMSQQAAELQAQKDLDKNKELIIKYTEILKNPSNMLSGPVLMDKKNDDDSVSKGVISATPPELMYSAESVIKSVFDYVITEVVEDTKKYFSNTLSLKEPAQILALFQGTASTLNVEIAKAFSQSVAEFLQSVDSKRALIEHYSFILTNNVGFGMATDPESLYACRIKNGDVVVDSSVVLTDSLQAAIEQAIPERLKSTTQLSMAEKLFGLLCSNQWKEILSDSTKISKLEQYYANRAYHDIYDDLFYFILNQVAKSAGADETLIDVKLGAGFDDLLAMDYKKRLDYHDFLKNRDVYDDSENSVRQVVKKFYEAHALDKIVRKKPRAFDLALAAGVVYFRFRSAIVETYLKLIYLQKVFSIQQPAAIKKQLNVKLRAEFGERLSWYCRELLKVQFGIVKESDDYVADLLEVLWPSTMAAMNEALFVESKSLAGALFGELRYVGMPNGVTPRLFADANAAALKNGEFFIERYVRLKTVDGEETYEDVDKLLAILRLAEPTDLLNVFYDSFVLGVRLTYVPPAFIEESSEGDLPINFAKITKDVDVGHRRLFVVSEAAKVLAETQGEVLVHKDVYPISLVVHEEVADVNVDTLAQVVSALQNYQDNPVGFAKKMALTVEWKQLFQYCFPLEQILSVVSLYVLNKNAELYGDFERNAEACVKLFKLYTEQSGNKALEEYIENN